MDAGSYRPNFAYRAVRPVEPPIKPRCDLVNELEVGPWLMALSSEVCRSAVSLRAPVRQIGPPDATVGRRR
jgi:hypothetical protein